MPQIFFPPSGACDCHVHVVGPKDKFPLAQKRAYTPMDATVGQLRAMLARLNLDRVVLVQMSVYGTDNSCMLNALRELDNARGVAVLPPRVPDDELALLHRQGIRGLRVNVATSKSTSLHIIHERISTAAALCERHQWHVQVFIPADTIEPLAPFFASLSVPLVIDHFGLIAPDSENGALHALIRLLRSGKVWVKISAAYRIADDPADARVGSLVRRLCDANPERIVWGSDWPHTPRHDSGQHASDDEMPFRNVDTRKLLDLVPRWLDDTRLLQQVMVTNPAQLYGFE